MLKCICDETKPYIFVSYSHKDSAEVQKIIERMYEDGYNVWFDEGIDPGTEWDEYIASHVEKAGCFIAFVSKNYLESSNCKDELNYARDLDIERLIIYLEEVELPKGMQMRLNRLQSIYKYKYKTEESFIEKLYFARMIEDFNHKKAGNINAIESNSLESLVEKYKNDPNISVIQTPRKHQYIDAEIADWVRIAFFILTYFVLLLSSILTPDKSIWQWIYSFGVFFLVFPCIIIEWGIHKKFLKIQAYGYIAVKPIPKRDYIAHYAYLVMPGIIMICELIEIIKKNGLSVLHVFLIIILSALIIGYILVERKRYSIFLMEHIEYACPKNVTELL